MKPLVLSAAAVFTFASGPSLAADAQELLKEKACLSCHTVDKKLVGPAYKEVAAKYKGKPDAKDKLFTHLTTNPKVKIDGKEETHDSLKTKNDADVRNVVDFVLTR